MRIATEVALRQPLFMVGIFRKRLHTFLWSETESACLAVIEDVTLQIRKKFSNKSPVNFVFKVCTIFTLWQLYHIINNLFANTTINI